MKVGNIFFILGITNSGKSTIHNKLLRDKRFMNKYNLRNVILTTTRKARKGEVDGTDYIFRSNYQYEHALNNNELAASSSFKVSNNAITNNDVVYYGIKSDYFEDYPYENYIIGNGNIDLYTDLRKNINNLDMDGNLKYYRLIPIMLYSDPYTILKRAVERNISLESCKSCNIGSEDFYNMHIQNMEICRRYMKDSELYFNIDTLVNTYNIPYECCINTSGKLKNTVKEVKKIFEFYVK